MTDYAVNELNSHAVAEQPEGVLEEMLKPHLTALGNACWGLLYHHDQVQVLSIGQSTSALAAVDLDTIKEARFFSMQGEWKLWRYNNGWQARLRVDDAGDKAHVLEENLALWGTKIEQGCTLKEEGRGCSLVFPVALDDQALPYKVRVRSYFIYDADGLIRFTDARLMTFVDKTGKELPHA